MTQALLRIAPVLVFRALIDHLTHAHARFAGVAVLLGLGLVALLLTGLASVLGQTLSTQIAENIVYDLRQELYERLIDQSVDYFTRRRSGEIISHLVNDVEGVERVLSDSLLIVLREACLLMAIGVLMFVLDWRLALLTILIVPVLWVPFRYFGQVAYRAQGRVQDQLSVVTTFFHETLGLSGLMLVKAFSRTGLEKRRFAELNEELRRRQLQASQAARWLEMGTMVLSAAGPIVLLLAGGLLVTQGSAQLGTVLVFATILVAQLAGSAGELGRAVLACIGSLAPWRRVFGVLDEPPGIVDSPGAIAVGRLHGSVTLHDVNFTYPGAARPALQDINVEIEPGQLVALVGPSGAGKSTFHALVARFMDPRGGSVALDGVDLRDLTLDSLHREIGVVFQDTFLFHATLRENLRYGRPDASDEQIWAAARDANLDALIRELPDALDTMVGERGHRLSGGEKQRVAIARVLLKEPRVLLLDEATAHLDNVSERLIQAALHRLLVGRTALVIAHRLSTVLSADLILVLEGGRIVERGTHGTLLEQGGLYARLHASQGLESPSGLPVQTF
jgi:ATP-binding cassette, subfamily B, bacterial